jgi:membrane fusion protein (multidrug efflux system)
MDNKGAQQDERKTLPPPLNGGNTSNGAGDESIDHVPMYRKRRIVIPAALVAIAAIAVLWYWYINLRDFVSTDDAYVEANRVSISAKMLGRVSQLAVDEGDSVIRGQFLVQLDNVDILAQKEQAVASLNSAGASVTLSKVNLSRAEDDFRRADQQFKGGVVTKEQYDHARQALDASRAEYGIALSRVGTARAQVGVVQTQLNNCTISSPVNGKVAKRWALQGDVVQPGQPIFSVIDRTETWVTANLEETHLHEIRIGQNVDISVDTYPDRKFSGKVFQLGSSTAAQFALIPPNNASGNFTKVTQRVPVKISIMEQGGVDRLPASLLPGMSVEVKIKIR